MAASAALELPTPLKGGLARRDARPAQVAPWRHITKARAQEGEAQRKTPASSRRSSVRCRALSSPTRAAGTPPVEQPQPTARRVVLAVDASEDSLEAFNWVLNNLLKAGDELHLLHVVPDVFVGPSSGSIYYCSSPDPETERLLWQQAKQFFMDNFLEHAKSCGLEDSVWLHLVKERRHKHIGKAVCKKAEELGAEPLVVAAHDKGLLEKFLLGSVSQFCVSHCKRPVLLLHPNHSSLPK